MKQYYFLCDLGEISLPSESEIQLLRKEKEESILLILDSCICLEIINLIKHKKSAHVDKKAIYQLIEYVQKHKVNYTPIFALTELCYDRTTFKIQEDKFWDFKNKLDFAFQYPLKHLKKLSFDYDKEFRIKNRPELLIKSIEPFTENLNLYYAGLLKIRKLADKGLKKDLAQKNIKLFIDWMVNELDVILGPEYSLALNIFGGNTDFRSMIKLDSSKEKSLKAILGSAWDLFHARMSCNRPQINDMVGEKVQPIFVTKDALLFKLMSPFVEHSLRFNSMKMTITTENDYPPHYSDSFLGDLNKTMLKIGEERVGKERTYDISKMTNIITSLEESLV